MTKEPQARHLFVIYDLYLPGNVACVLPYPSPAKRLPVRLHTSVSWGDVWWHYITLFF